MGRIAQTFKSKNEIKESLHTFAACSTKRKLEEAARRENQSIGEVIDSLVAKHLRSDGIKR